MRKLFLAIISSLALLAPHASFAYQVWMGVSCTPGSAAVYTNTWTNTADQVMGININMAACKLATPATTAQWQTIFNQFQQIDGSFSPIPRSAFGPTGPHPTTTITNIIDGKFADAATYGYTLGNLMFYNNAVQGTNYGWSTNDVQQMRNYLDFLGHTNVGLLWDDRAFDAGDQAWDNNPLVTGILLECGADGWFANAGNRTNLLHWLWTNSATATKQIIFQIPDYGPGDYGPTNKFMADRLLLQWLGTQIMDSNFMASSRVVFMPVTYGGEWFYPETASPNVYTNSMTSLVLSLIEQKDLFEGRSRLPTVADAFSFYRNSPPVIGPVSNLVVSPGSLSLTIPFTVNDRETPAAALTVGGSTSNASLVTGLTFGGGGATRTVTATLNPALTGTATIMLVASDAVLTSTNLFQLTVYATASVTAAAGGPINASATWGVSAPVAGDTNLWQTGGRALSLTNSTETFYGNTFIVQTNGQLAPGHTNATLNLNNLVLAGGVITMDTNYALTLDLSGTTFTLNSGFLKAGANTNRNVIFRNGALVGNGTIFITGTDTNGAYVEFQPTVKTAGFTGVFNVVSNGILNLPPVANATFGLNLSGSGKYFNDTNVALTSLQIQGASLAPGSYTYASFTTAQKTNLLNNGGTITVLSNTPPALTGLVATSIFEDTPSNIPFLINDANTAASNLVVCGYSSNPTLVPNENLSFSGSGSNRTLQVTSGLHQFGTNTLYVTVSDGWLSTTRPFNLAVIFTNYPPTLSPVPDQVVNANTPTVAIFTVGDIESDPGQLTVAATSSNPALVANTNLLLGGSGANRSVKILPTSGQTGVATISLTVSDGVNVVTNSFHLSVVPVHIINAVANGALDTNTTWSGGVLPVAGDTNTWQSGGFNLSLVNQVTTFYGNTLVIQSGDQFAPGLPTVQLTLSKLVLAGGTIYMGNNGGYNNGMTIDLGGQPLTLNSGTLKSGTTASFRNVIFQDGSLLGSGTINIIGSDTNGNFVQLADTITTRWFTGNFNINNYGLLYLPAIAPADASFGLNISGTGTYVLSADTALTSLVIAGTNIPPGVYTFNDFDLNQESYLLDNGGSITVVSTNNTAPVLAAISNVTLIAGRTLAITNLATDKDVPAQTLTFTLPNAPTGAVVDPVSGLFSWRPTISQSPSTNMLKVVVTDSGWPILSATQSFTVTVTQPAKPSLRSLGLTNGLFSLAVTGTNGPDYIVLTSTNLLNWTPLATNSAPTLPFTFTDATTNGNRRFYRVLLGP